MQRRPHQCARRSRVDRVNGFALVLMTQLMPQDADPIRDEVRRADYADLAG
jgi:hypothetical protein